MNFPFFQIVLHSSCLTLVHHRVDFGLNECNWNILFFARAWIKVSLIFTKTPDVWHPPNPAIISLYTNLDSERAATLPITMPRNTFLPIPTQPNSQVSKSVEALHCAGRKRPSIYQFQIKGQVGGTFLSIFFLIHSFATYNASTLLWLIT